MSKRGIDIMIRKARLPFLGIAVATMALLLGGLALAMPRAEAQVLPPHALSGAVTLDGSAATSGTSVEAVIDGTVCGQATVNNSSRYVIQVAHTSATSGCGTDGATISFRVGGNDANETFEFKTGGSDDLDLSAESGGPPPTVAPPTVTPETPTPVIVTGSGGFLNEDGSGTPWWAMGMVLAALTLASAGLVAYRRVTH